MLFLKIFMHNIFSYILINKIFKYSGTHILFTFLQLPYIFFPIQLQVVNYPTLGSTLIILDSPSFFICLICLMSTTIFQIVCRTILYFFFSLKSINKYLFKLYYISYVL